MPHLVRGQAGTPNDDAADDDAGDAADDDAGGLTKPKSTRARRYTEP